MKVWCFNKVKQESAPTIQTAVKTIGWPGRTDLICTRNKEECVRRLSTNCWSVHDLQKESSNICNSCNHSVSVLSYFCTNGGEATSCSSLSSEHPSSALSPGRDKRRSCRCSALIRLSLLSVGTIIRCWLQSAIWAQRTVRLSQLSPSCFLASQQAKCQSWFNLKQPHRPDLLSSVHTCMGLGFSAHNVCLTKLVPPPSVTPHHLGMCFFNIARSRRVCFLTPGGKWVLYQTLDSNIPVNSTISQPRAHTNPPSFTTQSGRNLLVDCECSQSVLWQVRTEVVVGVN